MLKVIFSLKFFFILETNLFEGVYKDLQTKTLLPIINVNTQSEIQNEIDIVKKDNDVTGGIAIKIQNSILIAKNGIDVFIVKAGTLHSKQALLLLDVEVGTKITNKN